MGHLLKALIVVCVLGIATVLGVVMFSDVPVEIPAAAAPDASSAGPSIVLATPS
jgi:hypothetical protein